MIISQKWEEKWNVWCDTISQETSQLCITGLDILKFHLVKYFRKLDEWVNKAAMVLVFKYLIHLFKDCSLFSV